MSRAPLRVALPKGRLLEQVLALFRQTYEGTRFELELRRAT